eukprot:gene26882-32487_t
MMNIALKIALLCAILQQCASFRAARSYLPRSGNLAMAQKFLSNDAALFEKLQSKLETKNSGSQDKVGFESVGHSLGKVEAAVESITQPAEEVRENTEEAAPVVVKKYETDAIVKSDPVYQEVKLVEPTTPSSLPSLPAWNPGAAGLVFAGAIASVAAFFITRKKTNENPQKGALETVKSSKSTVDNVQKPVLPVTPKVKSDANRRNPDKTKPLNPQSLTPSNSISSADLKAKAAEEKARAAARKEEERRRAIAKALAEEEAMNLAEEKAKAEEAAIMAKSSESSSKVVSAWEAKRSAAKAAAEAEARRALATAKSLSEAKLKAEAMAKDEEKDLVSVASSDSSRDNVKGESIVQTNAKRAPFKPDKDKRWTNSATATTLPKGKLQRDNNNAPKVTVTSKKAEEEARQAAAAAKAKVEEEARQAAVAAKAKAEEEARQAAVAAKEKAEEETRQAAAAAKAKVEEEARQAAAAAKAKVEEEARQAAAAAKAKAEEEARQAAAAAKAKAEEEARQAAVAAKAKAEEEARQAAAAAKAKAEEEAEEEARQAAAAAKAKAEEEARQAAAAAKAKAEEEARQAAAAAKAKAEEEARQVAAAAKAKAEEETRQVAAAAKAKADLEVQQVAAMKESEMLAKLKEYDLLISRSRTLQERAALEVQRNEYKRTALQSLRKERSVDARLKAGIVDAPVSSQPPVPEVSDLPKDQPTPKSSKATIHPEKPLAKATVTAKLPPNSLSKEQVENLRVKVNNNIKDNEARRQMLQNAKEGAKEIRSRPQNLQQMQQGVQESSVPLSDAQRSSLSVEDRDSIVALSGLSDTLDEMEAAAEANIPTGKDGVTSADALNNILTALSKLPIASMRDLIVKRGGNLDKVGRADDIGDYLEVSIPLFWATNKKNWSAFVEFAERHIFPEAQTNSDFMQASILAASSKEFTDKSLKDLIKKYKGASAIPRPKKTDAEETSVGDRLEYIGAFLDVLRVKYENDYRLVNQTVQHELEALVKSKPKGFGGAPATPPSKKK